MSTTSQIANALEESGIPFTRVEGVANGIEYWGLSVRHENVHAEVRECSKWVEMKAWHYTPEQFMDMLVGTGTCHVDALNTGDCAGYECSEYIMHCNECGHEFGHVLYNEDGDVWMSEPPNFCPNCGKKVEKVSE